VAIASIKRSRLDTQAPGLAGCFPHPQWRSDCANVAMAGSSEPVLGARASDAAEDFIRMLTIIGATERISAGVSLNVTPPPTRETCPSWDAALRVSNQMFHLGIVENFVQRVDRALGTSCAKGARANDRGPLFETPRPAGHATHRNSAAGRAWLEAQIVLPFGMAATSVRPRQNFVGEERCTTKPFPLASVKA